MQLSIIVPAYNEESRIPRMLEAYLPYFNEKYGNDVEMIVVVNGSKDQTAEVVRGYQTAYPGLICDVEPDAIGKGGAVTRGFDQAQGRYIGFVDADGSTPPEAFDALMDHIDESSAVIASRWIKGAVVSPRQPLDRRIASRLFNILVRILFGIAVWDTQCGAKLLPRSAWLKIRSSMGLTRWAFDVDMLFQLRRSGTRIKEIPTEWHDVAGSKLNVPKASFEMFVAMVRLRLMYSPFKFVVKIYDVTLGQVFRK
jgi:glycosyltransferase involved in cell wall biosynthesis